MNGKNDRPTKGKKPVGAGKAKAASRRKARRGTSVKAAMTAGAVVGAVGAVGAGAACLFTKAVSGAITGRKNRLLDKLVGAAVGDVAPDGSYAAHSQELMKRIDTEEVSIRNAEGLTLKAHWYHCAEPKRVAIMAHGWHGLWTTDFGDSIDFYHDNGCELLYIEHRAHGGSEGKYISYGIKERFDMIAWVDHARERFPDLPIYLCGISMGASTVLMTAGEDIADKVTAICADCGYTDASKVVRPGMEKVLHGLTDTAMKLVDLETKHGGGFTLDEYTTLSAMDADTEVPILFIHGDADDFVPVSMTLENYIACRAPKELMIVHGAAHGLSYIVDTETYQTRVLAFFDKWDGRLKHI